MGLIFSRQLPVTSNLRYFWSTFWLRESGQVVPNIKSEHIRQLKLKISRKRAVQFKAQICGICMSYEHIFWNVAFLKWRVVHKTYEVAPNPIKKLIFSSKLAWQVFLCLKAWKICSNVQLVKPKLSNRYSNLKSLSVEHWSINSVPKSVLLRELSNSFKRNFVRKFCSSLGVKQS